MAGHTEYFFYFSMYCLENYMMQKQIFENIRQEFSGKANRNSLILGVFGVLPIIKLSASLCNC